MGINLRYKFPMLCAMVGSAIAGLVWLQRCSGERYRCRWPAGHSVHPATILGIYAVAMLIAIAVPMLLTVAAVYKHKFRNQSQAEISATEAV